VAPKKARNTSGGGEAANGAGDDPTNETVPAWAEPFIVQISALKEDHDALKERFDKLTEAFEPVITYALLETAIYEFAKQAIPAGWEDEERKINHSMSFLCGSVLTNFLSAAGDQKKLSWQGPSTKPQVGFPKASIPNLVRRGLAGLAAYIEHQDDAAALQNMDPGKRNMLAHNGTFLDAVLKTPTKNAPAEAPGFQETKAQVKEARLYFGSAASSGAIPIPSTIDNAVALVVDALDKKGLSVDCNVQVENINMLKAFCPETQV